MSNVIPFARRAAPAPVSNKTGDEPPVVVDGNFVNLGSPGSGPVVFMSCGDMFVPALNAGVMRAIRGDQ